MVLSDIALRHRLELPIDNPLHLRVTDMDPKAMQGASIDLRLGNDIIERNTHSIIPIGVVVPLVPHACVLVSTHERVHIPADCVARVEGKSSIGRQFVVIHCTAGWIDPGFYGNITLEIVNHNIYHFFGLVPGMFICQLTLLQLDQPAQQQYMGRYQGDVGAQSHKL